MLSKETEEAERTANDVGEAEHAADVGCGLDTYPLGKRRVRAGVHKGPRDGASGTLLFLSLHTRLCAPAGGGRGPGLPSPTPTGYGMTLLNQMPGSSPGYGKCREERFWFPGAETLPMTALQLKLCFCNRDP